jgi:alpha-glucosidase (family GH31 glycosyl hydrolase)
MTRITNEFTLMPVINAGITIDGAAYEQGIKQGVFITDANGKRALVAKDWSGSTTFVDFFQPNATKYWQ